MTAAKAAKADATLRIAARYWWRSLRPLAWDQARHLDFPTVNTTTVPERNLAMAVAATLRDIPQVGRPRKVGNE